MRHDIIASTTQLPVGQGGLMTFLLRTEAADSKQIFRAVYDCGSVNREHLDQGLSCLDEGNIDILFISHLDADHVNGVDKLLERCKVHTVVLPCIDQLALVVAVGAALAEGGFSKSLRDFLFDPARWLRDRGVSTVLFLNRDDEDGALGLEPVSGEPTGPVFPNLKEAYKNGPLLRVNGRTLVEVERSADRTLSASTSIEVEVLGRSGGVCTWRLVPYVYPFPQERLTRFLAAIRGVLKVARNGKVTTRAFQRNLMNCLADEASRALLKSCYSLLSSDSNKPSMSLFSSPGSGADVQSCFLDGYRSHPDRPGWMSTGDADLFSARTRTAWMRRFSPVLRSVGAFQLPHHGSNRSIHDDVLHALRYSTVFACAAEGRAFHPHPHLRERLRVLRSGDSGRVVSEAIDSMLHFEVRL